MFSGTIQIKVFVNSSWIQSALGVSRLLLTDWSLGLYSLCNHAETQYNYFFKKSNQTKTQRTWKKETWRHQCQAGMLSIIAGGYAEW